jgi:hypothetical protein
VTSPEGGRRRTKSPRRVINYQTLGSLVLVRSTREKAREWVRWAAANNIDGIKFFNRGDETPEIIAAAIDEAHKNKMGTVAHLSQNGVANFNARDAGEAHLDSITHYYGHMESLRDRTIQEYPIGYDYNKTGSFRRHRPHLNRPTSPARRVGWRISSSRRRNHVRSRPSTSTPPSRDPDAGAQRRLAPELTMPQL